MKKEYTYSMPQKFMDDPNVALKWKLYGYLNGFWLSGKPVYARNDTIAKQFGKSERAVQFALEELETMGLITRDIKGLSRYILPGGLKEEGRSPASPTHEAQLHQGDEAQLHHISYSISDSINGEANAPRVVEVQEKPPKEDMLDKASKYWFRLCEKEAGQVPSYGLTKVKGVIKTARKSLSYPQIQDMMKLWFETQDLETHEMIQITRCLSSFQIDKYLAENV